MERDPDEAAVNDSLNELEEGGKVETEYEEGEEPRHSLTEEGAAHAEETIRDKETAQLMLLRLHWNYACVEEDTTHAAIKELLRFVAEVRDDMGVNLLRAHQKAHGTIKDDPIPSFSEPTIRRFDP